MAEEEEVIKPRVWRKLSEEETNIHRSLDVYLHGELAGKLDQYVIPDRFSPKHSLVFTYDPEHLKKGGEQLSISLPLQEEAFIDYNRQSDSDPKPVRYFFRGLLPESKSHQRLSDYLDESEKHEYVHTEERRCFAAAFLTVLGGDCAGAITFHLHNTKPPVPTDAMELLDEKSLYQVMDDLFKLPMLVDKGYRLSLAGAQEKLPVGFVDGKVALMKGGGLTTHILKPALWKFPNTTYNEYFCMTLAQRVGLEAPNCTLLHVGDSSCFLIERYDRYQDDQGVTRSIHQEDFCQIMSLTESKKFEFYGGPGIQKCMDVIGEHCVDPGTNKLTFLTIILYNFIVGNSDAHHKNYSLLYDKKGLRVAPAYDILSMAVYPDVTLDMAMRVGEEDSPDCVKKSDFFKFVENSFKEDLDAAKASFETTMNNMMDTIEGKALELKKEFEEQSFKSPIYDEIIEIIKDRVHQLRTGPKETIRRNTSLF
ncbi:MAG: HipA domain-containing protein [Proteobacteria bacterium]|nr:HipA domain-containing protein [Pseudomonadota bacterium]